MLPILSYEKASYAKNTAQSFIDSNKLVIIGCIQNESAEVYVFNHEEVLFEEHLKSQYVKSTAAELKDNFQKASVLLMQVDKGTLDIKKLFGRQSKQRVIKNNLIKL